MHDTCACLCNVVLNYNFDFTYYILEVHHDYSKDFTDDVTIVTELS